MAALACSTLLARSWPRRFASAALAARELGPYSSGARVAISIATATKRCQTFQPLILKQMVEHALATAGGEKGNSSGPKTELERVCERNLQKLQRK